MQLGLPENHTEDLAPSWPHVKDQGAALCQLLALSLPCFHSHSSCQVSWYLIPSLNPKWKKKI